MDDGLKFIILFIIFSIVIGGLVFIVIHYQQSCDKGIVCEKAVGSSFGPNYLRVDCDSPNVDRRTMRCKI